MVEPLEGSVSGGAKKHISQYYHSNLPDLLKCYTAANGVALVTGGFPSVIQGVGPHL